MSSLGLLSSWLLFWLRFRILSMACDGESSRLHELTRWASSTDTTRLLREVGLTKDVRFALLVVEYWGVWISIFVNYYLFNIPPFTILSTFQFIIYSLLPSHVFVALQFSGDFQLLDMGHCHIHGIVCHSAQPLPEHIKREINKCLLNKTIKIRKFDCWTEETKGRLRQCIKE
jgi:hypothetical protein